MLKKRLVFLTGANAFSCFILLSLVTKVFPSRKVFVWPVSSATAISTFSVSFYYFANDHCNVLTERNVLLQSLGDMEDTVALKLNDVESIMNNVRQLLKL